MTRPYNDEPESPARAEGSTLPNDLWHHWRDLRKPPSDDRISEKDHTEPVPGHGSEDTRLWVEALDIVTAQQSLRDGGLPQTRELTRLGATRQRVGLYYFRLNKRLFSSGIASRTYDPEQIPSPSTSFHWNEIGQVMTTGSRLFEMALAHPKTSWA